MNGVLPVDLEADHCVPAPPRAADAGLHGLSVRIRVSAATVQFQPADLRDGQPAVPDAHLVGDGEGGRLVAVLPLGIAAPSLEERLPGVGLILEGVADDVVGVLVKPRLAVPTAP